MISKYMYCTYVLFFIFRKIMNCYEEISSQMKKVFVYINLKNKRLMLKNQLILTVFNCSFISAFSF